MTSLFKGVPADLVDAESFWFHSLACGMTARTVAAHRSEDNVERFFVVGLLHDIGHMVTYMSVGEQAREALDLARATGQPLPDCEREVMGCDHGHVGRALLEKWNFPRAFLEAVGYHHRPHLATRFPVEAAAAHVAEVTSHALRWGRSGEEKVPPFDPTAWATLGLDSALFPLLVEEAERQLEASVHFMGAET